MKFILALLFLIGVFSFSLKAGNYLASDISYTCLGGNTYLVTYSYYHYCDSLAVPNTHSISYSCSSNSSLSFTSNLTLIPGTGMDVTPICGCDSNTCQGGTSIGVREYIYQAQVTLAACDSWHMKIDGCCRKSVNTVQGASNSYFIEAVLDNVNAPGNSGPGFTNKPFAFPCNGKAYCFNQGAFDPDGDSLVYSFTSPKKNISLPVSYTGPLTATNFLVSSTPLTLDPVTGDICFTPSMNLNSITGVRVDQYRKVNGVVKLIGTSYRDLFFQVMSCSNSIPKLSGIDTLNSHTYNSNDTIHYMDWPIGKAVDFDINGFDADTFTPGCVVHPERFSITWNNGMPAGTFTPSYNGTDSAYAHFHWQPSFADVATSPHCFTVMIADGACPYGGYSSAKYCLTITSGVGIDNQDNISDFQVFPNPNSGMFEIDYQSVSAEKCQLQILNAEGKKVYSEQWNRPDMHSNHQLNLTNLPDGLYYINIRQANRNSKAKIIIKK